MVQRPLEPTQLRTRQGVTCRWSIRSGDEVATYPMPSMLLSGGDYGGLGSEASWLVSAACRVP
uniref:Uncharacterized protein n=1 Tax=Leifsonia xyli subsp. cynodontis TaxID=31966 RepID=Q6EEG9_LEIXC|nr:unknown [Leifsonia xyli subsp. cynodontis]